MDCIREIEVMRVAGERISCLTPPPGNDRTFVEGPFDRSCEFSQMMHGKKTIFFGNLHVMPFEKGHRLFISGWSYFFNRVANGDSVCLWSIEQNGSL